MSEDLFNLCGKVALVTGGSRGLGRAIALEFADYGADLIIVSRKLDNCIAVATEVEAKGRRALAIACHIGRWPQIDAMVERAYAEFGRIDILVNNAGMSPVASSTLETVETLIDSVMSLNFKGPFRLGALVGSRMAADGGGGSIINISSAASLAPHPTFAPLPRPRPRSMR